MEILIDKEVKTRKAHNCFGCFRTFPAGTTMHYQKNVHDGEIYGLHICQTCRELLGYHIWDEYYEQGYAQEDKNSNEETVGMTMEAYLAYMQAKYEKADFFNQSKGFLWEKDPAKRAEQEAYWSKVRFGPYPHVHTPLPGGGHVTSDAPLDAKAMEVVNKMVEHFRGMDFDNLNQF